MVGVDRYQGKAGFVNASNRREIAARLRALIAGHTEGLPETAQRLGVEELSLRMSLDEVSPFPTVDVLIAFVAAFGVDPTWLLTGTYDAATHRRVLDDAEAAGGVIRRLAIDTSSRPPVADPADEPRLHIG